MRWLKPGDTPNTFKTTGVGQPEDITLVPFYKIYDRLYSVYWDIYDEAGWSAHQHALEEQALQKRALEEATHDLYLPGDEWSEKTHQIAGEKTYVRNFKDRDARSADRGGWFALEMDVIKGEAMSLVVEYWGGFTGTRTFDIEVNDQIIATENISGKKDGHFIDVYYDIPEELTQSTSRVTVKFNPHVGNRAGPVFAVRMVKKGF
jgi:hypothetical protein